MYKSQTFVQLLCFGPQSEILLPRCNHHRPHLRIAVGRRRAGTLASHIVIQNHLTALHRSFPVHTARALAKFKLHTEGHIDMRMLGKEPTRIAALNSWFSMRGQLVEVSLWLWVSDLIGFPVFSFL